jgi:hypothetical protein
MLGRVRALPAIDLAEHAGVQDAKDLNREALAKHKKRDFEGSAEGWFATVEKDPGHVVARFNLACAMARLDEADAAFEVLGQLEKAGCPQCLGQVLVADRDKDWDGLRGDPRLKKMTRRVYRGLVDSEAAAGAILDWFEKWGDEVPATIDPRRSIKLEMSVWAGEETKEEKSKLTGAKRLRSWVKARSKEAMNGYDRDDQDIICRGECCSLEKKGGISHHTLYLVEACFKMEGDKPVYLKKLTFYEG